MFAASATSITTFLFVAGHTGRIPRLSPTALVAFFAMPVVTFLASLLGSGYVIGAVDAAVSHGLTHLSSVRFGSWYWVNVAYNYGLQLVGFAYLLLFAGRGDRLAWRQGMVLLLGFVAATVVNVLWMMNAIPRTYDPMPMALAFAATTMWWGAFRFGVLDLVPVARHALVDAWHDGVVVIDGEKRVLDVNQRMAAILGIEPTRLIGRRIDDEGVLRSDLAERLASAMTGGDDPPSLAAPPTSPVTLVGASLFRVRAVEVGTSRARAIVFHDVTVEHHWQDEQARLIAQLQHALVEVKTLRGLLPICAHCKKIRDVDGGWQPMEQYIRDRTDAEFSHGMCPSCIAEWYPGFDVVGPAR